MYAYMTTGVTTVAHVVVQRNYNKDRVDGVTNLTSTSQSHFGCQKKHLTGIVKVLKLQNQHEDGTSENDAVNNGTGRMAQIEK